jgi:hypothetical protein
MELRMSRTRLLFTCFALGLAAAACQRGATPTVKPQANAGTGPGLDDSCPASVPATTVTVVNTKSGVAMFFTTTSSNVGEVRRRVAAAAKVDTTAAAPKAEELEMPDEMVMPEWVFGEQPELVPLQAKVEEVADGAALLLTPIDTADVDELRAYAHSHANKMRLGRCPTDFMKMPREGAQNAVLPPNGRLG